MLIKISLRKINSPLSLRGAKRRSNLSGFSLIELMVAVTILAMAIFGIFNAFSSGWMGMANARDRTVATNYAQEILEDIKNTPFEKIHSESTSQIEDTKFSRNINSININQNIKEVTAQVTWKNWRGSVKNVEASTLIYSQASSKETSGAVTLVLYAKPYYSILPESTNTMLTALVQDANGNLVTDWNQDIFFSIPVGYSGMGTVPTDGFTPNQGKVTGVIFVSSGEFGDVVIIASSSSLTVNLTDSITLKITDAAVAIKLEADPVTISTGGPTSRIDVSLLNASYVEPPAVIDEHLVTFYLKEGPGTITPISVLLNKDNGGTSYITLTPSGTPGIVTIIASSMDLESGVINVPILGTAESISITATPSSINLGEDTNITITIKDSAGNSVLYIGDINLSLSDESKGGLSGADYNEDEPNLVFSDESSKTITFTALDAGEVNITASALSGGLSSDTVTIYISEGRKIELTAVPDNIMADGKDPSTITATILDMNNVIVTDEIYDIVFEIVSGYGDLSEHIKTTVNGVATTSLTSTSELDVITVSARAMGLTTVSVDVQTTYPKSIFLSADKKWLYIDGKAHISINVVDSKGEADYFGSINLTLNNPELGYISPGTLDYPYESTADFTASSTGEVTITAYGDGINSDSITIQIIKKGEALTLITESITISTDGQTITFNISNDGIVGLEIVQMQVIWNFLSSTLGQVQVRAPTTSEPVIVYNGPAVDSGTLINIEPTILPAGTSTISLDFSGDMNGETITVTFFDFDSGYGPLGFNVP